MKKRIILIKSNRANFMPDELNVDNVSVKYMFKDLNSLNWLIKEIQLHFNLLVSEKYYNIELIDLDTDVIIVTDCHLQTKFIEWLHKNNYGKRLIVWYWNTIQEVGRKIPLDTIPDGVEKWSYSKHDCKKYGLNYNTTCYPYCSKIITNSKGIDTDIYFLGKDKGRLNYILEVQKQFERLGLRTLFHICPTKRYQLWKKKVYRHQISYNEVMKQIAHSRAILDCCVSETAGPTIRAMESMFFQRKLITNDKKIKNCDYYNPNNIFILGHDNMEKLKEFINSPYVKLPKNIVQKYTMEQWFSRFFV